MKRVITPPRRAAFGGARLGKFSVPFTSLKNHVLGPDFDLSLVFTNNVFSRQLNTTYRGKDKPANVLSFSLSKKSGEIFIDLITAKKDSAKFEMLFGDFVIFLFIHGLLHLKGMRHGDTMEKAEKKILHGASNLGRHRYRNFRSQGGYR